METPTVMLRTLRSLGPAIIVAAVVLGPGSILTSSKVGCQFGYSALWILVLAGIAMAGMVALSARLGAVLSRTPCEELAVRLGRPFAALVGVSLFLVAACFQFSNNLGVVAAVEPFLGPRIEWRIALLALVNGLLIAVVLRAQHLYRAVEWVMKIMVAAMIVGFAANLIMARPDPIAVAAGLVPGPLDVDGGQAGGLPLLPVLGMVATTFSVGAAFYHAYLVRAKGWGPEQSGRGVIDSIVGCTVLASMTAMILVTSAAVLHGRIRAEDLTSAADVARQLEPLFGRFAQVLFCQGVLAGALSSFLVNAMIGGTILSDGLGLGRTMEDAWPRRATVLALLAGMAVAMTITVFRPDTVGLIIFAQSVTVLVVPLLAASMLYLALRAGDEPAGRVPAWLIGAGVLGLATAVLLAVGTVFQIVEALARRP